MANKPIINAIDTFDPAKDKVVYFTWSGNQIASNRLVITNTATGVVVYDKTIVGYRAEHNIVGKSIPPKANYSAQIYVTDTLSETSPASAKALFYAVTTPVFAFSNVVSSQEIANSSYEAMINYSSTEQELLKEFYFQLYDNGGSLLYSSNMSYDTSQISYKYTGLEDSVSYYFRAKGSTINGLEIDTGSINVNVKYSTHDSYSVFELENVDGYIKYTTNLIIIEYNGKEIFTYDNGFIDLTKKELYYDSGFSIIDDFIISMELKGLTSGEIFSCKDSIITMTVDIFDNCNEFADSATRINKVCRMVVDNSVYTYSLNVGFSVPVIDTLNAIVKLKIMKKGNMYVLDCRNV